MFEIVLKTVQISLLILSAGSSVCEKHSVLLNGMDYRLLWWLDPDDITFEVQVKTHGFVGFGLSDGNISRADFVIGWIQDGHVFLEDRHINFQSLNETSTQLLDIKLIDLERDSSQDYTLLLGYENTTHTVLRFRRKLNTCDPSDVAISNNTMTVLWMTNSKKPKSSTFFSNFVFDNDNENPQVYGSQYIYLLQRLNQDVPSIQVAPHILELRNSGVKMPAQGNSVIWCRFFQTQHFLVKHHLIRYEPLLDQSGLIHLQRAILYECQENKKIHFYAKNSGQSCQEVKTIQLFCKTIIAIWAQGSEGFTFPPDTGYPLESIFYLLETHYFSPFASYQSSIDSSGIRLYYTPELRQHDAGFLSIGVEPNWRHIIPPGQRRVHSSGHCISECTHKMLPKSSGINIFALAPRVHSIGRQMKLRHVRGVMEFPPLFEDNSLHSGYQENRRLNQVVQVLPGDHLIVECEYDSSQRSTITLGGWKPLEETCIAVVIYYPLQRALNECFSAPSLSTVLNSLGIEKLQSGSNILQISAPLELLGMTLETRILTYDWRRHFGEFQLATQRGSFKPLCRDSNELLAEIQNMDAYFPNITTVYEKDSLTCHLFDNVNSQMIKHKQHTSWQTNKFSDILLRNSGHATRFDLCISNFLIRILFVCFIKIFLINIIVY